MKKNLLIVGLMLALSLSASAQNEGFAFGFKVGPNLGWTGSTTGAAVNVGTKAGFDLGVVAEYYFADNYALVSGINVDFLRGHYTFTNARMDSVANVVTYSVERVYKSTLYEIPLMLKMVTNELGDAPLRVYAQVGGGIGYAQKVKVKDGYDGAAMSDEWGTTNKEFSNIRVSLKAGAGVQYSIDESTRLFAGLYFSHDLLNNINSISPNHYKYYDGNKQLGEREKKLNVLQNRLGLELGILF
jgi:hypothetical protein